MPARPEAARECHGRVEHGGMQRSPYIRRPRRETCSLLPPAQARWRVEPPGSTRRLASPMTPHVNVAREPARKQARIESRRADPIFVSESRTVLGCGWSSSGGRTLEDLLRHGALFSANAVIKIGIELCHAVSAVHAAGLLHRDIKAQNVMMADDGRVVLMDFGAGGEFGHDRPTGLAGTPLYLAPELPSGENASVRSDIYSIGVLLYHVLTESYPVAGTARAA